MSTLEKIVILGLAGYRITRLIIEDHIFDWIRNPIMGNKDKDIPGWFRNKYNTIRSAKRRWLFNELYMLLGCAFCISVYVSILLWNLYTSATVISATVNILAVAGIVAFIYDIKKDD